MVNHLNLMSVVEQKFTSGKVEVFANVLESKIQDIKIYGDFFGIEDVAAVENVLRGVKYERERCP